MKEQILMWIDEDEFNYALDMQNEARTLTIPLHTFPIHHSDIPIKITISSREELDKEFLEKYPDWDKFL